MEGTCRKDNWDEGAIRALIFSYYDRLEVLESKFSNSVTQTIKASAWIEVVDW